MEDRLKAALTAAESLKTARIEDKVEGERAKPAPGISPGRKDKKKLNGAESRQGEHRDRSKLLVNTHRQTFHCDVDLWKDLKIQAMKEEKPISELLNIILREGIQRRK
jgi:hypothetical protein